jgi:predicted acylesterase/phospholipase RssA
MEVQAMMDFTDEDELEKNNESNRKSLEPYKPKHMVICGGGAKGKAYKEALRIADENQILDGIQHFYGSSVGGLTAAMLALGMSRNEINNQLDAGPETLSDMFRTTPLSNLRKPLKGIKNFVQNKSLYKGYKLFEMSQDMVAKQLGHPNATFEDLANQVANQESDPNKRRFGNLYVTATVMDKRGPYQIVLSHETVPNMPIALALRMTAALPGAFPSIKITPDELKKYRGDSDKPLVRYNRGEGYGKDDDKTLTPTTSNGLIEICDGGFVDNLPQYLVQNDGEPNRDLISLNLAHPTYLSHKEQYKSALLSNINTNNEKQYVESQKRSLYYAAKEKYKQFKNVRTTPSRLLVTRDTTADFNTYNIMASDFDLTRENKQRLDKSGREGMETLLIKQHVLEPKPQPLEDEQPSDQEALQAVALEPGYQAQDLEAELIVIEDIISSANELLQNLKMNLIQFKDLKDLKQAVKDARHSLEQAHQLEGEVDALQYYNLEDGFVEIKLQDDELKQMDVKGILDKFSDVIAGSRQVEAALNEVNQNLSKFNYFLFKLCNSIPKLDKLIEDKYSDKYKMFSDLRKLKDIDQRLKQGLKLARPVEVDRKRVYLPMQESKSQKSKATSKKKNKSEINKKLKSGRNKPS